MPFNPALNVKQPNLPQMYATIAAMKGAQTKSKLVEAALAKGKDIASLESVAAGGSGGAAFEQGFGAVTQGGAETRGVIDPQDRIQDAWGRLLQIDPEGTKQKIDTLNKMDARTLRQTREKAASSAKISMEVLAAPQEAQAMAYVQALGAAKQMDLDVSRLPEVWNPLTTPALLQRIVAESLATDKHAEYLEKQRQSKENFVTVMGPGGPRRVRKVQAEGTIDPGAMTGPQKDAMAMGLKPGTDEYNKYISARTLRKGFDMQFNPDGTVASITMGGSAGGGDMTKKTRGTIEGKLFAAQEGLARLDDIKRGFKPEYQQIATRWNAWATAWQEKAEGTPGLEWLAGKASPEDKKMLAEFSVYKRKSIENINLYIKEITGAQMSEPEANRLRKAMPDPGEGIFDGNSPTEFKSKMDDVISSLRKASARYAYSLRNGLDPMKSGITLDGIQKIMTERQNEITAKAKAENPEITDEALRSILQQRLGREFGLVF